MRKIAFVLLLFSFLYSCDKNEELKQDENLKLKYKGVITVNNDNSRRAILSFYKDMTYDISTTISPIFGNEGDKYMSSASGIYREEDDRIVLDESAQISIWKKVGKYEWEAENKNTMELSKWFPTGYIISRDNIGSLSDDTGISVNGTKF